MFMMMMMITKVFLYKEPSIYSTPNRVSRANCYNMVTQMQTASLKRIVSFFFFAESPSQ